MHYWKLFSFSLVTFFFFNFEKNFFYVFLFFIPLSLFFYYVGFILQIEFFRFPFTRCDILHPKFSQYKSQNSKKKKKVKTLSYLTRLTFPRLNFTHIFAWITQFRVAWRPKLPFIIQQYRCHQKLFSSSDFHMKGAQL